MVKRIIFLMFFISGFCALLYQTIWLRLAFANFGVNTQVVSIVVSIFMLGLVLGSLVSAKYLIKLSEKYNIESLYFYSLAEIGVGVGALVVPNLFLLGHDWLLSFGQTNSTAYLFLSALVLSLMMIPWCFFMGTTIPLIMDYVNKRLAKDKSSFSFLYLANTFGAMTGTLLTALVLIESFGFQKTLMYASFLNFLIAIIGVFIVKVVKSNFYEKGVSDEKLEKREIETETLKVIDKKTYMMFLLLFITGFSSMGFEVVWSRLFTPILETSVYAFAFVLFLYFLGTCFGLLHYRFALKKGNVLTVKFLLLFLGIVSVIQIWFVDPRFHLGFLGVILCVGSISYILGYLTPKQIDELSEGSPRKAGFAYAVNLFGCIVGPIVASYLFMPLFGSKISLILLSLPLIVFLFTRKGENASYEFSNKSLFFSFLTLILITIGFGTTYEEWLNVPNKIIKNDYNATTLAATLDKNNPRSKYLMVNGVGMTMLTPITKVMAHLPLFELPKGDKKALIICFGMGTTFRSAISWGVPTTAVELTPGVAELFPYFFDDASEILKNKNNQIVVDDGRRFLQRNFTKYDLIAIDPPPPIESAGSSLLYSEEFYKIVQKHLTEKGILSQWYPEKNDITLQAVARSLVDVFPYIKVYKSVMGNGYHFLASNNPIIFPSLEKIIQDMPEKAQNDLMEWNDNNEPDIASYIEKIFSNEEDINKLLNKDEKIKVTDDKPYNEYFFLRNTN